MTDESLDYAGFWRRVAAYVIDNSILYFVYIQVYAFVLSPAIIRMQMNDSMPLTEYVLYGVSAALSMLILQWAYFIAMEASPLQASCGKLLAGLYVTNLEGERISLAQANGRFFGKILSSLIVCVGFVMAAFTHKKQALHDMMANTLVLKK